jgi:hypothetical protein
MLHDLDHKLLQFVEQSNDWKRLKNVLVQNRDNEKKDWNRSDVYYKARLELRSKVQQLMSNITDKEEMAELWIRLILQRSPSSISNMKLGLNKIWKTDMRSTMWKTKFQNEYDQFYPYNVSFER